MRTWQRHAENLERYYVQLYYYLEGQRTVHHVELCDALSSSASKEVRLDHWVRIVDYRYSLQPLSAAGSVIQGGRFNIGRDLDPLKFPTFPALYLAEDYETAYRERFGVSGDSQGLQGHQLALRRPESFTSVVVQGTVLNVFDLRSDSSLRAFANIIVKFKLPDRMRELAKSLSLTGPHLARSVRQVKATLLAHDWRLFPVQYEIPSNSQVFGRLLLEAGFDGVLYRSRKGPSDCIALFPENFANSDSSVQVTDEAPAHADMLRLDSSTWRDISGATGG